MVNVPNTPEGFAAAALAHMLLGLIKADDGLSISEIEKIEILVYKMRHDLPADYEEIMKLIELFRTDEGYIKWTPDEHLDRGLMYFDQFVATGSALKSHFEALYDIFEIIVEVGTITSGEEKYLARIYREFTTKYGMKKIQYD